MKYWLGIDIGTTSVKATAFSEDGDTLMHQSGVYEMIHPLPGQSEQDPNEIAEATIHCITGIVRELLPVQPAAIAFSAVMHSLIAVNENGDPLTNCIIWADNRAVAFAEGLKHTVKGKTFYEATGVPIHAMSPFCKLLWLKENNPVVFNEAYKFIGIKEYIFFRLFGVFEVDTGIASATGLLNLRSLRWDKTVLDYLGLEEDRLSTVVEVKRIFTLSPGTKTFWSPYTDLLKNIPFVIGGSDGASANLSAGALGRQSMVVTIGTSSAARILSDRPVTDEAMRTFCYHAIDGWYIVGGAGNNGAIVLEWLKNTFLEANETMDQFLELADKAAPGCDGLTFLPYILGERAPLWNAQAKGVLFGLTINHTKAHMVRAAMEAVIYSIYSFGKAIMEKNTVMEIRATGGFAQNPLWVQILADVFNRRTVLSGSVESSAWGSVIIARTALGLAAPGEKRQEVVYTPDSRKHDIYSRQFKQFEHLTALLKNDFTGDAAAEA